MRTKASTGSKKKVPVTNDQAVGKLISGVSRTCEGVKRLRRRGEGASYCGTFGAQLRAWKDQGRARALVRS